MKKFCKAEKILIALVDLNNHTTYRCDEHGVFQQRNDKKTGKCPYCKIEFKPLADIAFLKGKFRHELGFD